MNGDTFGRFAANKDPNAKPTKPTDNPEDKGSDAAKPNSGGESGDAKPKSKDES